jgi:hypothetical protein
MFHLFNYKNRPAVCRAVFGCREEGVYLIREILLVKVLSPEASLRM